jgi:hypothetical protein
MSFLWNKDATLDERVLRYTAGEDYALDARLVRYDVAASIAHAEMLHAAKLLTSADLQALPPSRRLRMNMRAGNGASRSPMKTARRRSRNG